MLTLNVTTHRVCEEINVSWLEGDSFSRTVGSFAAATCYIRRVLHPLHLNQSYIEYNLLISECISAE